MARHRGAQPLHRRAAPQAPLDRRRIALASPFNLADEAERNLLGARPRRDPAAPSEQRKTLEMAFFDGLTHSRSRR